jgi:hypothetical protein
MPSPNVEKIVNQIWQNAEKDPSLQLYAILDSARDTRIYYKIAESEIEVASLFRGEQARELVAVAPYLVRLHRDDPFVDWLFTYGWGESWGIVVESPADLNELRRHFRDFIMVYDEAGKPLYFRYYDPRVFRVYLPTCNESELRTVFGPVNSYYVEGDASTFMIQCSFADSRLIERKVLL